jgi:two-component system, NarL family, nitrate/nitrite response regulator NarL
MPTVLIVEEDIVFRKQLLEVFDHGKGFDAFVEAGNGVEALDKTKCLVPNLAILDLSLPDVGGIQLAQELMEIMPGLRIFMLTADYSMKTEKKALSCGITAVFSKLDDLSAVVANARAVCGID